MAKFQWDTTATFMLAEMGLEARVFGPEPAHAPTIVLLHEGLGCVELWREFPQALATQTACGVFAYSRAAYGASRSIELPRPSNYLSIEAQQVLPRVLELVQPQEFALFGHSDGATISAIYAGTVQDQRLRAAVISAPHFFIEQVALDAIADTREQFRYGELRARLEKYHRHVDAAFYGWSDTWLNPAFRNWDVSDVIDGIQVPVLGIQGEDDQYGTARQVLELDRRMRAPVDIQLLENCGHVPHLQQPDVTLSLSSTFLADKFSQRS